MTATVHPIPPEHPTHRFLTELYAGTSGHISLFAADRVDGHSRVEWGHTDNISAFLQAARRHKDTSCVWFGVATRKANLGKWKRGGVDDCATITALWADIDIAGPNHAATDLPSSDEEAHQLLSKFPLPATVIVRSGGGLQAWWFLSSPIEVNDDTLALLERWGATWAHISAGFGWHIDNVFNADRIMRLPGTRNRKTEPVPVTIERSDYELRYSVDDVEQHLIDTPEPEATAAKDLGYTNRPYIGPERPGDHFNAQHDGGFVLDLMGLHLARSSPGQRHYRHPVSKNQTTATVYEDDGHVTIWSEQTIPKMFPAVATRRPYDPFGLYAAAFHNGDFQSATAALRERGYGARPVDHTAWLDEIDAAEHVDEPNNLDDTFWNARPHLTHIRQAAHARIVAPDAVLAACLARVAFLISYSIRIPAIIGAHTGLTYMVCLVGNPEAGKGAATSVASELLPSKPGALDNLPIGSGEGMVEVLFDFAEEPDEDGKPKKVKKQVHHNAFFNIDEGQVLSEIGGRSGSTLLPTLRSAWSSKTIGNTNASAERRRLLDGDLYTFGVVMGIQPEVAAPLLDDKAGGTPQRFLYASAIDPTAPDDIPEWPGQLPWTPPDDLEVAGFKRVGARFELHIDKDIRAALITDRQAVQRGEKVRDGLDAHSMLLRLKTAALLALLDGYRHVVRWDDWELAGVLIESSRRVRSTMISAVARSNAEQARARIESHAERELTVEAKREARAVAAAARAMSRAVRKHADGGVHGGEGCVRKCLTVAVASRDRKLIDLDDAIAHAIGSRWLDQSSDDKWLPGHKEP